MKVRVNETLAKGLTNRLYDEMDRKKKLAFDRILQVKSVQNVKSTRKQWVRTSLGIMSIVYDGTFIMSEADLEKRKNKPTYVFATLVPDERMKGRFVIYVWLIDTKKCRMDSARLPIVITKHAIERVFLRLNSTKQDEVFSELKDAFSEFMNHLINETSAGKEFIPPQDTEINLGSENGMFIGKVTKDREIVFTTFVDTSKLSESQLSGIT